MTNVTVSGPGFGSRRVPVVSRAPSGIDSSGTAIVLRYSGLLRAPRRKLVFAGILAGSGKKDYLMESNVILGE